MNRMKIVHTEMRTYQSRWMCDENGCPGEMIHNNLVIDVMPPLYQHTCNVCKRMATASRTYPGITHK